MWISKQSLVALALSVLTVAPVFGQAGSVGADVYVQVANSVVLIEVRDQTRVISQATAFVVEPSRLLTNSHAVVGGSVWVKVGPVSLSATVERVDAENDLALLRVNGELSMNPLKLTAGPPRAGSKVFALGNPLGLERTITDGLITGLRTVGGRSLLQISAAISPGSSGGPILNEAGEVVGVAVGSLTEAQNLNFAVPASVAASFLRNEAPVPTDSSGMALLDILIEQRRAAVWSEEPTSAYQQLSQKLERAIESTVPGLSDARVLTALYAKVQEFQFSIERPVVLRLVAVAPRSSEAQKALAESYRLEAIFAETEERQKLLLDAEAAASKALTYAGGTGRPERLLLGQIQVEIEAHRATGITNLTQVYLGDRGDLAYQAALDLFEVNRDSGRRPEARKWFESAEALKEVPPYWYGGFGTLLEEMGDGPAAARAFARASTSSYKYLCNASRLDTDLDVAIAHARDCLAKATADKKGEVMAAYAHRLLAVHLLDRGVVDQAISHAKESIAIDGTNGLAFGVLASALLKAERWSEAENAARSAIRLTDGAYESHHFTLGQALFSQQRWSEAKTAYEQSARMDTKDPAAPFNVALCLVRMGFQRDSVQWWEEALRRNPNASDAPIIRQNIELFRLR